MRSVVLLLVAVLFEHWKALMAAASHLRRSFAQWAGPAWAGKVLPVWVYASVYVSNACAIFCLSGRYAIPHAGSPTRLFVQPQRQRNIPAEHTLHCMATGALAAVWGLSMHDPGHLVLSRRLACDDQHRLGK